MSHDSRTACREGVFATRDITLIGGCRVANEPQAAMPLGSGNGKGPMQFSNSPKSENRPNAFLQSKWEGGVVDVPGTRSGGWWGRHGRVGSSWPPIVGSDELQRGTAHRQPV